VWGCLDGQYKIVENGDAINHVLGKVGNCPLRWDSLVNGETSQESDSGCLQVVVEDTMHILDECLEEVTVTVEFASDELHVEEISPFGYVFPERVLGTLTRCGD
jgi:hypothetical protein